MLEGKSSNSIVTLVCSHRYEDINLLISVRCSSGLLFVYTLCFSTLAHVSLYQIQWFLLFSLLSFFHPKKYCTGNFLILRVCVIISRKFSRFFLGNLYHYQNDWMLEVQWERVEGERQWLVCVFRIRRAANGKITLFCICSRFSLKQRQR